MKEMGDRLEKMENLNRGLEERVRAMEQRRSEDGSLRRRLEDMAGMFERASKQMQQAPRGAVAARSSGTAASSPSGTAAAAAAGAGGERPPAHVVLPAPFARHAAVRPPEGAWKQSRSAVAPWSAQWQGADSSRQQRRAPPAARRQEQRCFNCDQYGHIAFQCKQDIICYRCRQVGHKASACPSGVGALPLCAQCGARHSASIVCHVCHQPGHVARCCRGQQKQQHDTRQRPRDEAHEVASPAARTKPRSHSQSPIVLETPAHTPAVTSDGVAATQAGAGGSTPPSPGEAHAGAVPVMD